MVAQAEEQILVPLVPQGPVIVKVVLEGQGVLCGLFTICVNQSVWACQQSCFRERAFRFRKLLRKGYTFAIGKPWKNVSRRFAAAE